MNIKRVINFGASVAAGKGLEDIKQSYPYLIHSTAEVIVHAKGGKSNLENLYDIIRFKFEPGDAVVMFWGPVQRDVVFGKNGKIARYYGPYKNKNDELFNKWLYVHDDIDMSVRSWLNIQHADLLVKSLNLPHCHILHDSRLLENKLDCINIPYIMDKDGEHYLDYVADKIHPGVLGHQQLADKVKQVLSNRI